MKSGKTVDDIQIFSSLLSWERGLKSVEEIICILEVWVAPLVGAWIEILIQYPFVSFFKVAPLVGAWIEIMICMLRRIVQESLLSWERGLKS